MQGALIIFALISVILAQTPPPPGGCCFYSKIRYDGLVACTSAPFTIAEVPFDGKADFKGIRSAFCDEGWSAAILQKGDQKEVLECGEAMDETLTEIPTDQVMVGACSKPRCCFYTGRNKDGNEYCMFADQSIDAELKNAQTGNNFLVGECTATYKATLTAAGGKTTSVDCGLTLDLTGTDSFDKITISPCTSSAVADEAVVDTMTDAAVLDLAVADVAVADQAVVDVAVADQAVVDVAVADQAVADVAIDEFQTDFAVTDAAEDDLMFADQLTDAALLDLAVADAMDEFQTFEVDDNSFAIGDEFQTLDHDEATIDQLTDAAVADTFQDQAAGDEFLGDYNADQAVADAFNDQFAADQAFTDNFDALMADQAVQDTNSQSSATSIFVSLAVVVASIVALLF